MINETNNSLNFSIRPMTQDDLDRVIELEINIFPDPWSRSVFEEQFSDDSWGSVVALSDGLIIGYACYLTVGVESHLTNIAVDPDYRRKLVAYHLLATILEAVKKEDCEYILLEVRPSNKSAISFYNENNFSVLCRYPGYYRNPTEDAYVMVHYFNDEGK
ncbi:MAG: ribosomal protein S18-alanine N-acetyltransferase [candidate division Zixibacteria bacterium]|nr:ribosomal protein S18-alanine N-acetyltransferase [candidate division Zixibacteria bacterium]